MWMLTILTFVVGVITGGSLVAVALWYVLSSFFHDPDEKKHLQAGTLPGQTLPPQPTSATFQLPPLLLSKISDESCKAKESCWGVNFILYFMFRELKHSESVRRWILRKLALEFDELLTTSALCKVFSNITIQNMDLGQNFPVVNWLRTAKVELHPVFKCISTLDIIVDLDYAGGFQFAIKAESHLRHSAYISIKFNAVKGQARLQFASEPYAHWSFSFAENPEIDISVSSQVNGKSFTKITAVIATLLKRSVKKKHTLPMYKIRYKPFFNRIQPFVAACCPSAALRVQTTGTLTVSLVECRGLMQSLLKGNVFATFGIANFDWVGAYESAPKFMYVVRDIGYIKTAKREAKLDFIMVQHGEVCVIESVESSISVPLATHNGSNAVSSALIEYEFEPGDEIIAVDGKRVSTIKQCIKNFWNSTSVRVIWRIRRNYKIVDSGDHCSDNVEEDESRDVHEIPTAAVEPPSLPVPSFHTNFNQSQTGSRRNSFTGSTENIAYRSSPSISHTVEPLFKTNSLPACRDPIFQESFLFTLQESQQFINITCWSSDQPNSSDASTTSSPTSTPVKRPKVVQNTSDTLPFGRHSMLGTLSIPLADIVSECSTTGMGFFVKDFYFNPPDGSGAIDTKDHELKSHSGFERAMCFGKATLSFHFEGAEDSKRKQSAESASISSGMPLDLGGEVELAEQNPSPNDEPERHRFVRVHFRSSAVCDYCNKKIWLKEAYNCESCGMKCHKKCNERCMTNTICRGEMYHHGRQNPAQPHCTPEIITTESEPRQVPNQNEHINPDIEIYSVLHPTGNSNNVRRRTLGGLIASATRSVNLKRTGSATTLLSPSVTVGASSGSKSLPPSPEATPLNIRKVSTSELENESGNMSQHLENPFEVLDPTGSGEFTEQELTITVENLIHRQTEDLVSLARDSGRDLYSNQNLPERKEKLNSVLTRLQEEIDALTLERKNWTKEEATQKTARSEEKVGALALLMLHYCAGLQNVQDLEELHKYDYVGVPSKTFPSETVKQETSAEGIEPKLLGQHSQESTFHIS